MIAMIVDSKGPLDDHRDTIRGPHIAGKPLGGKPLGGRSMRQQRRQLRSLFRAQPWRHARRWPTRERLHPAPFTSAPQPVADRSFTDPQRRSDILLRPSFLLQDPRAFAPLFAPVGFRWCSHTPTLPRFSSPCRVQ